MWIVNTPTVDLPRSRTTKNYSIPFNKRQPGPSSRSRNEYQSIKPTRLQVNKKHRQKCSKNPMQIIRLDWLLSKVRNSVISWKIGCLALCINWREVTLTQYRQQNVVNHAAQTYIKNTRLLRRKQDGFRPGTSYTDHINAL